MQVLGQSFNALAMGRTPRPQKVAWASGRSGSSGSLSGAEPSSEELVARGVTVSGEGADASRREGTDASLCSEHRIRLKKRYLVPEAQSLGAEACTFRDAFYEARATRQGWIRAFLRDRFHVDDDAPSRVLAVTSQVQCAVRTAEKGVEKEVNKKGKRALSFTSVVPWRFRARRRGAGRRVRCPLIHEELWSWFVDRLHKTRGIIGTQLLIDQANVISADLYEDWQVRHALGHADASSAPKLPEINPCWMARWRKAYGVTFRTVNLRYKISHSKRISRLRVFWG